MMKRICVLGVTGSGKTTLARSIADRLGYRHIEMDALFWEPGWVEAPRELFRSRVAAATDGDGWVTDGNYSSAREITWSRADTFVWLDLPFPLVFSRLIRRTIGRAIARTELWNGNREPLWVNLFSSDSIFLWAIKTYPRYRREFPPMLAEQASLGKTVYRLRSSAEADQWLAGVQMTTSLNFTGAN